MSFTYKQPRDKWDSVLDHTPVNADKTVEVMALNGYVQLGLLDAELGRVPAYGDKWFVTKSRCEDLLAFGERNRVQLIKRL